MSEAPEIESASQFSDSPAGLQQRWDIEISAAIANLKDWQEDGDKTVKEFLGEGKGKRLNLYHADVVTKGASLYANITKVTAKRRFSDAADDAGRV